MGLGLAAYGRMLVLVGTACFYHGRVLSLAGDVLFQDGVVLPAMVLL